MTDPPPLALARDTDPIPTPPVDPEQAQLDAALHHAASDLAASLKHEEQTRRRRRRRTIGVFVMLLVPVLITAAFFAAGPSDPPPAVPHNAVQQAETLGAEGWALWKAGDGKKAATRFGDAIALDPDAPDLHNGLGWALFQQAQYPEADASFARCVELAPGHPAALNGLGQSALARRDYASAIAYFQRAPDAPAANLGLAQAALLTGDFALAREATDRLAEVDPPAMKETVERLAAAARAGVLDDALRRQIEPAGPPANPEAAAEAKRGWLQWSQRSYREAEQTFERALALDPHSTAALNGIGWSMLNQGRGGDARPHFETCLQHEPDHLGALNGLARCQKSTGDLDAAIATWERGIALAPGQLNALTMGLSRTYAQRGNHARVAELLEPHATALADHPDLAALLDKAKAAAGSN